MKIIRNISKVICNISKRKIMYNNRDILDNICSIIYKNRIIINKLRHNKYE